MTHKTIEDSYCFKDAEHTPGTNKYTFKYNFQWRNIIHEHLTISIRSVKLWRRPRNLWVDNLYVHDINNNTTKPTSFDISITGAMTEFNNKMVDKTEGYRVYYNPKEKRIVFDCDSNHYFTQRPPDFTTTCSDDFKAITGITNFNDIVIYDEDEEEDPNILCFGFENVWDRENVHLRASFVDLGYQNFLGVSNEQFIPPKEYPISFTDQKFTIELFDSTDRPVELPEDELGGLVIEAILNSYIF